MGKASPSINDRVGVEVMLLLSLKFKFKLSLVFTLYCLFVCLLLVVRKG